MLSSVMFCKRCGNKLTGKQISYCSLRCSKLHLKKLYKERNREKLNAYNRWYRKLGKRGHPSDNVYIFNFREKYPICEACKTDEDIQICHIRPRWAGGRNKDNLITLCRKCHKKFDSTLSSFWKQYYKRGRKNAFVVQEY